MKCCNRAVVGFMAALVLLLVGCGSKKGTPNDSVLKNNVYLNKFFDFQVQIPETWTVLKKPSAIEMRNAAHALSGGNKQAAAVAVKSMARVYCLLIARNVVVGMSISVTAENLAKAPQIQTAEDYLEQSLDIFTGPGKPMQRVGQMKSVKLYGREFQRVELTGQVMGVRQHQTMFATIEKNHALIFVVTGKSPETVKEAMDMVGMTGEMEQVANTASASPPPKKTRTVAARGVKRTAVTESDVDNGIRLQGVGGSAQRRLAIINGKTFGPGDGAQVAVGKKVVVIRCITITDKSATITIDGQDGEVELLLN